MEVVMSSLKAPKELLCEYCKNPLGMDVEKPRFSWQLAADNKDRNKKQSAYGIIVSSSEDKLSSGTGDVWDSGKVSSSQSINIEYEGKKLESRMRYFWKVTVWDESDRESPESETAWFEMGLLKPEDWKAVWKGYTGGKSGEALYCRRAFELSKPIAWARMYISGLGYYELHINGERVGDNVLDPGWTEYTKTVLYVTYDVTDALKKGKNAVGVVLGNGWHGTPKLYLQLEIIYEDGSKEMLGGHDWSWSVTTAPIIKNDVHDGEVYDARLEIPGWDTPDFKENNLNWLHAQRVTAPGGRMKAQMIEPIKVVDHVEPIAITNPKPGSYVYDLGQNIAGWCILRVKGDEGTCVTLKFAEVLYEDGTVNQENLRTARAHVMYTLKGGVEEEVYKPRFTYFGYRYIEVTGFPGKPELQNITGCVVRNSVEQVGQFTCSNDLINTIQRNVAWTEGNNLHGAPTDCPQRNERQGWLNDMTVRIEESMYNYGLARFFTKWLWDIKDTQDAETGAVADTAPFRWGNIPADSTAISYVLIPWFMYLFYGDKRIVEEYYESVKGWADCLYSHTKDGLIDYCWYGDWCSPIPESWPPDKPGLPPDSPGAVTTVGSYSAVTPGMLMGTAHLIYAGRTIADIAQIIGRGSDAAAYRKRAESITEAFNKKFFNEKTAQYASGSQASNAFPLFLRLVPEGREKEVLKNIVHDVMETKKEHLSTGNHGTKFLMEVLAAYGAGDVAYKIATQTTYPSWGYMISMGATTNWERWEYLTGPGMNSHAHPCLGNVSAWFYKYLAGINIDPRSPGWERMIIKPHVIEGLNHVNASFKTVRGTVEVHWQREENQFKMQVTIPANSTATVGLPTLGAGKSDKPLQVTEEGRLIWENGDFIQGVSGINAGEVLPQLMTPHAPGADTTRTVEQMSDQASRDWIYFEIGSGTYRFELKRR